MKMPQNTNDKIRANKNTKKARKATTVCTGRTR